MMKKSIVGLILFLSILLFYSRGIKADITEGDEVYWIRSAAYFKILFLDRDIDRLEWSGEHHAIGKYIMGLAFLFAGEKDNIWKGNTDKYWDYSKDFKSNISSGNMPSVKQIYIAKVTMAFFAALTCLLLYYIAISFFDTETAIMSSILLASHPIMVHYARSITFDAPLLFFITFNVLLMLRYYKALMEEKPTRTLLLSACIGINTTIASGVKLNGAISIITFLFLCMVFMLSKKIWLNGKGGLILKSMLIASIVAAVFFIGSDPFFYKKPMKHLRQMIKRRIKITLQHRDELLGRAPSNIPTTGYEKGLENLPQKIKWFRKLVFKPIKFIRLSRIVKISIRRIYILLFGFGLALTLVSEIRYYREKHTFSQNIILLTWICTTSAGILTWVLVNWWRYYMPILPGWALITGYGAASILNSALKLIRVKTS